MAWKVGDEADDAAIGLYCRRFGQARWIEGFALCSGIVAALDVDGRAQEVDQVAGGSLGEDSDVIDAGQGGQNLGALHRGNQRSARSFELAHALVAIEAKNQKE